MARFLAVAAACLWPALLAQSPGAAERAYEALRAKDYDAAIAAFRDAIDAAPGSASLRKDLAYTYLKAGETEAARDQFAEAMRLDAGDEHIALEYAFLCYETKKEAEARSVFDRLRKNGSAAAEQAFRNIDRALAEGIARWSAVVAQSPENFSAHCELARLSGQRGDAARAAEHYMAAWRIRPAERELLLEAGRAWQTQGRTEQAAAALLAASRGSRPRVAEQARELLPARYPYPEEFRRALETDPANTDLRRELAWLLLEMKQKDAAEREFRACADRDPQELIAAAQAGFLLLEKQDRAGAMVYFDRVLKSDDDELIERVRTALRMPAQLRRRKAAPPPAEAGPKEMGMRSYKAGYLQDALKYFEAAHEADPLDFDVMLKLGWTSNALGLDDRALGWFGLARRSPDAAIAAEANRAYHNLRPYFSRWRLTAWAFPFYSSRWRDVFAYGQIKADVRLGNLPFRPYVSMRFIGDTRGALGATGEAAVPQYLSESSVLLALGLASRTWNGLTAWGEAGSAVRYTGGENRPSMVPDYRGGASFGKGKGHLLGAEAAGWFAETHDDAVFVSRFDNDLLFYSQNQTGYTLPNVAGLRWQLYWNTNLTMDVKRAYWANFFEMGPGVRFRWQGLPESLVFSVNALRGAYIRNEGNPRGPAFNDVRAGFWYAITR